MYQAEPILDNVGGYQSPFGSSYVEGATFGAMMLMHEFASSSAFAARGAVMDVVDALASNGLDALSSLLKAHPHL